MYYIDCDVVSSLEIAKRTITSDEQWGSLVHCDVIDRVNGNLVVRLSSLFDTAVVACALKLGFQDALEFLKKEEDTE
jgi:hypothetical protein